LIALMSLLTHIKEEAPENIPGFQKNSG